MSWRKAHGRAAELGRIVMVETLPVDELPAGVPGPCPEAGQEADRGRPFRAGEDRTRRIAAQGGRSRRARTELASALGVETSDPQFREQLRRAEPFRRAQCSRLALLVGGGECGPAPSAEVASAALALAGSRVAYSNGDFALGARLATDARGHLLAAHELCAKEAVARKAAAPPAWRALLGLDHPPAPTAPTAVSHAPQETVSGPGAATATPAEEGAPEGHPEPAPATDLEEPAR